MRKPVVDLKGFRLSKITQPEYRHFLYIGTWLIYLIMHLLTESFIPVDKCYVVHGALDDVIPFCEYFIIPYVTWYLLIAVSIVYFALYSPENFKRMMIFMFVVQMLGMVIYIVFPNRQDLRPEVFPRDNFCTDIVKLIYSLDTNTNVCPSMHVAISVSLISTWVKEKSAPAVAKILVVVFCLVVCISVAFVKQHSVVDIYAAMPVCLVAEVIAFWKYWKERFSKSKK